MQPLSLTTDKGKPYQLEVPTPLKGLTSKFIFAFAKSGSTLLDNLISVYCGNLGIPTFSAFNQAFNQGLSTAELGNECLPCFEQEGIIYTGFRHYPRFDLDIGNRKALWLVRDPRDMAVSMYYSVTKSHVIPEGNRSLQTQRDQANQHKLDEFALQRIKSYTGHFNQYKEKLSSKNVVVYRYEDVIYDKLAWFKSVIDELEVKYDEQLMKNVVKQFDIVPDAEQEDQHIRQVHPGNFKKKLSDETIEKITIEAETFLDYFNYEK